MTVHTDQQSAAVTAGDGEYREELRLPRAWFAVIVVPPLFTLVALVLHGKTGRDGGKRTRIVRVIAQTAILAAVLRYFSTLRIVVQGGTLTVGFRRLAEELPLQRITACEPTTYQWIMWGGYGIRLRPQRKMYNLPSDHGRSVRVTLDDGQEVNFSSTDPDAVCAAIRAGQLALAA